jgi:hypothetical protein
MKAIALAVSVFIVALSAAAQPTPVTNPEAFERLLLPVYVAAVPGAFGSLFLTELRLWNRHDRESLEIFGLYPPCQFPVCGTDPLKPLEVKSYMETETAAQVVPVGGTPGMFIYVDKERVNDLIANLRVFDLSRSPTNFGTELRVVRESEFATRIILPDVPVNQKFRNTLRIYARRETAVQIIFHAPSIIGSPTILPPIPQTVVLQPGDNLFKPAYTAFTNFQPYGYPLTLIIEPADPAVPIWAFVSVTNNETQHITTITPQR